MSLPNNMKARTSQATAVVQAGGDEKDVQPVTNENREMVMAGHNWTANSDRAEEINPLSNQYIPSIALLSSSNITHATTAYLPSSAGELVGSQKDISIHMYLSSSSGSITCSIEATNDTNSTSPLWGDISYSFYDFVRNAGGLSGSNYPSFNVATGSTHWMLYRGDIPFEKIRVKYTISDSDVNTLGIYKRSKVI